MISDVWSLGTVVLELVKTYNPFAEYEGDRLRDSIRNRTLFALSEKEHSPEITDFVSKCLEKDANQRWSAGKLMSVRVWGEE